MPQNLISEKDNNVLDAVTFIIGDKSIISGMSEIPAKRPFDERIINFLETLSRKLMMSRGAKAYPDVVTLGFWIRKASVLKLKERFICDNGDVIIGRGVAFHIAPSNVPVNYAYSLITGLLTGNANVVRIPSKDFPQVTIINTAIKAALENFEDIKPYICLVKYGRDQKVNDLFSKIADTRIIWGGDNTIEQIRKSPLGPRASEIAFADRYSLAIIDSDKYMILDNKIRFAEEFYNDTYLSDQNACTSPRVVVWIGNHRDEAKKLFWDSLHKLVKEKYQFQSIMGINKLTSSYLVAVAVENVHIEPVEDNLVVRVNVPKMNADLMRLKDNSGFFFEYDCESILELKNLCDNTHCQTIGFFGDREQIMPLLAAGIKGVDRVVPIGKTMDFDFIWDGYNLVERLTRTIKVRLSYNNNSCKL